MSFLKNHGTASGLGAALGALSGYAGTTYLFTTPELWLAAYVPRGVEYLAQQLGYSDLAEVAPWWPRDTPLIWMLPLTAIIVTLLTVPCRPKATSAAAAAMAAEQQAMQHMRSEGVELAMHHAELKTPSSKTLTKFEREAVASKAQTSIVSQMGADTATAQAAHAEYAAFLEESVLEWRLLRL